MRVVIEGVDLPGRVFSSDGKILDSVHVAIQIRREPCELVAGDAPSARWELDVRVVVDDHGDLDFRGPAVHGKLGERFLYLTWGNPDGNGFNMFRRAKLMLNRIDHGLTRTASSQDRALVATVVLTDAHGCPRCARVDPPAIAWRVE